MEEKITHSSHLKANEISFGVDIAQATFHHIQFLEVVDKYPCLFRGKYLNEAIRRYENMWLPLASKHEDKILAAPLDIEWVWHCHLLSPEAYRDDCEHVVNGKVDHRLMSKSDRDASLEVSKHLWQETYKNEPFEQDLPFGIQEDLNTDSIESPISQSELKYDIRAAVSRQCSFYYNVSLPHYKDKRFLKACVVRYKKFLYLKKLNPKEFIVPCYDNDLAWHTHQLFPDIYNKDTSRILGKVLNHDDSTTDRSPGSFLTKSFQKTSKLWKETYDEDYNFPGGMYRGACSRGLYTSVKANLISDDDESIDVLIDFVSLDRNPVGSGSKFNIIVALNNTSRKTILNLKGPKLSWNDEEFQTGGIDLHKNEKLTFTIYKKTGIFKGKDEEIASVNVDVCTLPEIYRSGGWCAFNTDVKFDTRSRNNVCLSVEGRKRRIGRPLEFRIKVRHFQPCVVPENLEEYFDIQLASDDLSNVCAHGYIAQHRIVDVSGRDVFVFRVVHNAHRNVSSAQVFDTDGNIFVYARNIDSSQLPLPTQVSPEFVPISLAPKQGERAFLVKDNDGDWAVIVGRWRLPDSKNKDMSYLAYRIYFTRTGRLIQGTFPELDREHKINFDGCLLDVVNGHFTLIGCSATEAPQFMVGQIVIGLLVVLCVPRPMNWMPGDILDSEATAHLSLGSMDVLKACGLHVETPSNFYRSNHSI